MAEQAKPRTHLLVAHCTTRQQTPTSANHKIQHSAQPAGCGCAKAIFPTTTKDKLQRLPAW